MADPGVPSTQLRFPLTLLLLIIVAGSMAGQCVPRSGVRTSIRYTAMAAVAQSLPAEPTP